MAIGTPGYGAGIAREKPATIGSITLNLILAGGAASPRLARRFLAQKLPELGFAGDISVVQLLASEVVSNAVRHGRPPFALTVEVVDGRASVSVSDSDSEHLPVPNHEAPADRSGGGRGLNIVDDLADAWGCEISPGDGKSVWFVAGPA
jgi:anti-sigma regulatory factor (Ser/Thr protein kinase)